MENKYEYLSSFIAQFNLKLPKNEFQEFVDLFIYKTYKKGDHLIVAGDCNPLLAFVLEGLVRFYFVTFEGKEFNQTFIKENQIAIEYYSGLTGHAAPFYIQAMEDTNVLQADYREIKKFYDKDRNWERIGRIILEENFMIKFRRESTLLLLDAKARYMKFKEDFPELFKRLSQHDIALYLGVNPSTLNRLIKQIED